jgi:hypothetical protein
MDLIVLVVILLAGFIIKYLIDVIASLSKEIKEIKNKCIKPFATTNLKVETITPIEKMNKDIVSSMSNYKKFFD